MALGARIGSLALRLGPLRIMLTGLVVLLSLFPTSPRTDIGYSGWALITTLLAPAIVPIVFMGLLLDMLMTRVWISSAQGADRNRLKGILIFETLLAIVMLVAWLPFFLSIGKAY
jgi:hypothetical protein